MSCHFPQSHNILGSGESRTTSFHLDKNEIEQVAPLDCVILRSVVFAHREKIDHSPRLAVCRPNEIHNMPRCPFAPSPTDQPFGHDLGPARRPGRLLSSFTPFHRCRLHYAASSYSDHISWP